MSAAIRAGIGVIDLASSSVVRAVSFRLNPDALRREIVPAEGHATAGAAAVAGGMETVVVAIDLDATDNLEHADVNPAIVAHGLHPRLAALESVCFPARALAVRPLQVFSFGDDRMLPVRVLGLSVEESFFDGRLNPIRAHATLRLEVIAFDDLDPAARTLAALQSKREALARLGDDGPGAVRLPSGKLPRVAG